MPIADPRPPIGVATPCLLEVHVVARRLSTCPEFVRRLIRSRQLPAIRVGATWRIEPRDLDAYLAAHRTVTTTSTTAAKSANVSVVFQQPRVVEHERHDARAPV